MNIIILFMFASFNAVLYSWNLKIRFWFEHPYRYTDIFVIYLQIFASPMYEYLDTQYGPGEGSAFSFHNMSFRVIVRGGYLAVNTFVAALLPFIGDFMSLTGALSTFPLTFVLANHMYLRAKGSKLSTPQKAWHWLNVVGFSCLAVAAAIAALRLIVVDSRTYHLFADL